MYAQRKTNIEGRKMLSKEDRALVREAARGLNGAAADNFETAVIARLQELLDSGVVHAITKNHVRACCTAELAKGK
jgi:hypothetical protein